MVAFSRLSCSFCPSARCLYRLFAGFLAGVAPRSNVGRRRSPNFVAISFGSGWRWWPALRFLSTPVGLFCPPSAPASRLLSPLHAGALLQDPSACGFSSHLTHRRRARDDFFLWRLVSVLRRKRSAPSLFLDSFLFLSGGFYCVPFFEACSVRLVPSPRGHVLPLAG